MSVDEPEPESFSGYLPDDAGVEAPCPDESRPAQNRDYDQTVSGQLSLLTGSPAAGLDPLAAALGEADDLLKGVKQRLHAHLSGQLDEASAAVDQCHSNILGHGHVYMDEAQRIVEKCQAKIDQHLITVLATCYNLLLRFGVTPHTQEQLEAFAAGQGRDVTAPPPGVQSGSVAGPAGQAAEAAPFQPPQQLSQPPAAGQAAQQPYQQPLQLLVAGEQTPVGTTVRQTRKPPPPKPTKHDDCCYWWILWFLWFWEWFSPYVYHWIEKKCIDVKLCDDKPQPGQAFVPPAWEPMPVYKDVELPEFG